jgi:hypothetical protein
MIYILALAARRCTPTACSRVPSSAGAAGRRAPADSMPAPGAPRWARSSSRRAIDTSAGALHTFDAHGGMQGRAPAAIKRQGKAARWQAPPAGTGSCFSRRPMSSVLAINPFAALCMVSQGRCSGCGKNLGRAGRRTSSARSPRALCVERHRAASPCPRGATRGIRTVRQGSWKAFLPPRADQLRKRGKSCRQSRETRHVA